METTYYIAFALESGEWDIVEEFTATDDAAAEKYAEENYADQEWYVLDSNQRNINA